MVRFFTFSQFHNKRPPSGSTYIRVNQLMKYWPEADLYKYGENPEVMIFQKVYVWPDYKFMRDFEGIKILDICDPDWLDNVSIKESIDAVDAVTCPDQPLADFISQLTDKPIRVIKDRFDLELIPKSKEHTDKAKTVVWFGYSHNAELLKPALNIIREHEMHLLLISNDNPMPARWAMNSETQKYIENNYTYLKYQEETIYDQLKRADFALLPKGYRPQDRFKSENKTIKANLVGLPVAHDLESFEKYLDAENRIVDVDGIRKEYDVRNSVKEYKELIACLKADRILSR